MRARRRRSEGSAPVRRLPTSRRACRRRSSFRCGPRCGASCSWPRRARSRSGRRGRAIPNRVQFRRADRSPSGAACARPASGRTASALVESPQSTRCGPKSHRSPGRVTGFSGSGGASFAFSSSSGARSRSSSSRGSNPVRPRSKSGPATPIARETVILVPLRPRDGTIHHQPERLHLRRGPLVAEDHRDLLQPQLLCRLEAQVAVHDFAVAAREHGNLEAELRGSMLHMRSTAASFLRGLRA